MNNTNDKELVKRRVLFDWDGDGYYNERVLKDTPPNLHPAQLYVTGSELGVFIGSSHYDTNWPFLVNSEDFFDPIATENRGFTYRRAHMSSVTASGRMRINFKGYREHQPHTGDPTNLLSGTTNTFDMSQYGYSSDTDANTYAPPAIVTNSEDQDVRFSYDDLTGITLYDDPSEGGMADYCGRIWRGGGEFRYIIGQNVNNGGLLQHDYYQLGFDDSPTNQYTSAVKPAPSPGSINWDGFPITAGTGYRIRFWVNVPRRFLTNTTNTTQIAVRLYSDGGSSATPNYTRQYLAGSNPIIKTGGWQMLSYTFTAPTGATQMAIDISSILLNCSGILIGGIMLKSGTSDWPDSRVTDSAVTFNDTQFNYVFPGDNNPYVQSFWVRCPDGTVDELRFKQNTTVLGTNTITTATPSTVLLPNTDWVRVDLPISASTDRRGVWFEIQPYKSGSPIASSPVASVDYCGFMITQGTTIWPYHAGELYGYEDVSDLIISLDTSNGKNNFMDTLPKEGTASVVLNNDDQRFSPSAGGFLAPYLLPNLKVKVQLWDYTNEVWEDVWSGWTTSFQVSPGTQSDKRAIIECGQGIERLADGTLHVPVQETITMDTLARNVIESSGWRSASTQAQAFVGVHTLVGINAYVLDAEQLYSRVDPGVTTIEISGTDWAQKTDPRKALKDALDVENAVIWINRNGSLNIINREYYIAEEPIKTLVLDKAVNKATYEYGQDIINAVEVTLKKPKAIEGQAVWKTNRPIKVNPRQVWTVELNPTFEEGRTKTVIEYTLEGMTKNVYTKAMGIKPTPAPPSATQAQKDKIIVELLGEAGERPQLRITNKNTTALYVEIEIKGDYLDVSGGEIIKMEDEDSINQLQTRHLETYSPTLLSTVEQAESYGQYIMLRKSKTRGEITSFRITVRNQDDLDRILAIKIGSILLLSEAQSGEVGLAHVVIGEDFEITDGNTVSVTYKTARTLQEEYAQADVTLTADATVNIIPDYLLPGAASTNGGIVETENWFNEDLETILSWQTGAGHDNMLILAPAPEQLRVFSPLIMAYSYVGTDDGFWGVVSHADDTPAFGGRWGMMLQSLGQDFITGVNDLKTTQVGVSPTATVDIFSRTLAGIRAPLLGVIPDGKYTARVEFFIGDTSLQWNTGGESSFMRAYSHRKGSGGTLVSTEWNSGSGAARTQGTEVTPYQGHQETQFRARTGTGAQEKSGTVALQVYGRVSDVNLFSEAMLNLHVLLWSDYGKISGVFLDTTISHKYTMFVRTDYDSIAADWTLTVIAEDGSTIGTDSHTVATSGVTKFEVNIPSGNKSAWGYLKKNTNDYRDTKLYIYGYGITTSSVSTYLDLLAETPQEKVYA